MLQPLFINYTVELAVHLRNATGNLLLVLLIWMFSSVGLPCKLRAKELETVHDLETVIGRKSGKFESLGELVVSRK